MPELYVEGGDPTRPYALNYETVRFTDFYRVRFILRDIASGLDVAEWTQLDASDFTKSMTPTVLLTQGSLPNYSGITALIQVNWGKIDWAKTPVTSFTTTAETGINPNRVLSRAVIMQRFKAGPEPKVRLTVGPGAETATHFNSFAAAIGSLYIPGKTITLSTFPCSNICAFSNQVLIECIASGYQERLTPKNIGGIEQGLLIPPFVTLRGRSDTLLYVDENAGRAPVLEGPFSFRLQSIALDNRASGYAIHIDGDNGLAKRSEVGPATLNFPLASIFEQCTVTGGATQATWTFGVGVSNGQLIRLSGCRTVARANRPIFGAHNVPNTTDEARIEIEGTTFNDGSGTLEFLKSFPMAVQHKIAVSASSYAKLNISNSAGESEGFVLAA